MVLAMDSVYVLCVCAYSLPRHPFPFAVSSHPFPYTNLISRSGVCLIMDARRWSCTPHYLPFPCLLLLLDTLFAYIYLFFSLLFFVMFASPFALLCIGTSLPWWETGIRERGFFGFLGLMDEIFFVFLQLLFNVHQHMDFELVLLCFSNQEVKGESNVSKGRFNMAKGRKGKGDSKIQTLLSIRTVCYFEWALNFHGVCVLVLLGVFFFGFVFSVFVFALLLSMV